MTIPFSFPRRHFPRPLLLALPLGLLLTMPGCRKEEVKTYLAPKEVAYVLPEPEAEHDHSEPAAPAPAPVQEAPPVTYTAPANWEKLPAGGMNAAQFICKTPQGEIAINITALASMEGKETMLVGMWRGVFGLPELSEEETQKALTPVEIAGGQGFMFEVIGDRAGQPQSILTAFAHHGGRSWFFKLQGTPAAVDSQKTAFTDFLKTVKF